MHFAAEKGQTEVACLLLQQKGIDYNQLTIFFLDFFKTYALVYGKLSYVGYFLFIITSISFPNKNYGS